MSKRICCIKLFFLLSILSSIPSIAQTQLSKIDSLKNFLETYSGEDTTKANVLIDLCWQYFVERSDRENIEKYAPKLSILSQNLQFKKGIGWSYLYMGIISSRRSNYKLALYQCFKGLKTFEEMKYKKGISSCYLHIGFIKSSQGNYEEAIQYKLKALKITEEIGDKSEIAAGYNNIGVTYVNMGNYLQALNFLFKSLKIKEELNDKMGISTSYLNIGEVLYNQGNLTGSMNYQEKALKIAKELNDKEGEGLLYGNIANIYTAQKKYQEALVYNLKSMKIGQDVNNQYGVNMSCINIGNNYIAQNKFNEALPYYLKAVKISTELGDRATLISSYNGLGNCYEQKKNYPEAFMYYTHALNLSMKINFKTGVRDAYSNLSSITEKQHNFEKALLYNKLFSNVKDTLLSEESLKQTAELNIRYETDKKEKEILLLNKDQLLKDKTLKEQRLVRIGLIIGLGLFLALSFLLYNRYRFKQKANLVLQKQKQEIHQKNTLIIDSIDYAKTIQEAILPDDEKLSNSLSEHFILYKPKAIVSGDFYWIGKKDNKIICAVADCTGHGVPGAFMSLLGHNILENVIQRDTSVNPGSILTALNEELVVRFSKGKEKETVKHGMDIALISIDEVNQELQYAGARNSLYMVRNNVLTEVKADKMSTGILSKDHLTVHYTNNILELKKGDMLYLFSDGFPDQKGGRDKKKFYYQPFKDLLISIHDLHVEKQKQQLESVITTWIGESEQIDDMLVMGIRI